MFVYPQKAEFNRVVPKTKIYAHAKVGKRVKELFVSQVDAILWKYKLAPETVNLPARKGIHEIEVFEIAIKTPDLDPAVLQAIDKAIPFPLIFQIVHEGKLRFAASWKRPSEADPAKWVVEALFVTPYQKAPVEFQPLPVALDLASLHEQIVCRHIPLAPRSGETLAEHVARFNALEAKQKTRMQLEGRLAQEKQFNRKVELNAQLRSLCQELESLTQS